jgi:Uncharacterized MobA-related protein
MITAILMAAGFSKRMYTNKLLLDFQGKPMIEKTMDLIHKQEFDQQLLIAQDNNLKDLANKYHFTFIHNQHPEKGQSQSLKLGIKAAHKGNSFMCFVADQPYLLATTVQLLLDKHKEYPNKIIVPYCHGSNRNPTIFPACYLEELLSIEGDMGGRKILKENPEKVFLVPIEDELSFFDIDTPIEYEAITRNTSYKIED